MKSVRKYYFACGAMISAVPCPRFTFQFCLQRNVFFDEKWGVADFALKATLSCLSQSIQSLRRPVVRQSAISAIVMPLDCSALAKILVHVPQGTVLRKNWYVGALYMSTMNLFFFFFFFFFIVFIT